MLSKVIFRSGANEIQFNELFQQQNGSSVGASIKNETVAAAAAGGRFDGVTVSNSAKECTKSI